LLQSLSADHARVRWHQSGPASCGAGEKRAVALTVFRGGDDIDPLCDHRLSRFFDPFGGVQMASVRSEVAGSIWKIEVAVGQKVAQGDALIIIESMKMEIPVEAPAGGTVTEIRVAEGDRIDEGAIVVVLG
jgi:acetyl-CoA carboxylase biotin carboxyl carrier protein